ncbi:carbohydrate ABC transporter substrate-binding protein, partial [candidate division KSB1 bacterium]|nr:carbohydrate ABC transporter substrate-binding protein [candidate division KSB1 bacterium]
VADEYEAQHPDVCIEFLTQASIAGGAEGEFIRTQLLGGVAPEIISMNTEAMWPDVEQKKGWWVPLDSFLLKPNPYVDGNERWIDIFRNQALTQAKRAMDGKLYCITYDIVETGIFYNKDILEQLQLSLPANWEEFQEMQSHLRAAGYIPLLINTFNERDWGIDLIFDQCFYEILDLLDYKKKSETEEAYYQGYLTPEELCWLIKKDWFAPKNPRYREVFRILRQWRNHWQLDLTPNDLTRLFLQKRAAMYWNGSWFVRRMKLDPMVDFKWAVWYPPPIPKSFSPYCCGVPQCVIGGAGVQYHVSRRAIDDDELEQTIDFLMFITAPRNLGRIVNEAGMLIPNVADVNLDENLKPFEEIVQRRYCSVKWFYSLGHRFTDHYGRMAELFLGDGISMDEFMENLSEALHRTADEQISKAGWQEPVNVPRWSPDIEQKFLQKRNSQLTVREDQNE